MAKWRAVKSADELHAKRKPREGGHCQPPAPRRRSAGSHSGVVAIENPGSISPSLDEPVVMAV
jgi:hypothetical protein